MKNLRQLTILPGLRVTRVDSDRVVLTRKFLDGVARYVSLWDGPVVVLAEENPVASNNLDNLTPLVSELPFRLLLVNYSSVEETPEFIASGVVLANAESRLTRLSPVCDRLGMALVFVTEYTLLTRLQINRVEAPNLYIRLKQTIWQIMEERRQRAAIGLSTGVQCNGLPTFDAYRGLNSNAMLFFDTRVTEDMLATPAEMTAREQRLKSDAPLQLVFSGRLIAMKGADHLILVAQELRKLGSSFKLTICGDGVLMPKLQQQIKDMQLEAYVELTGTLDFDKGLLPLVRSEMDLFVCCHRQGDPSCTYLETFSCGVPIVGYDNEAFRGVCREADAGWIVPMDDAAAMAAKIVELQRNRQSIARAAKQSLAFARRHTFELTFAARTEHLKRMISPSA